MKKIILIFFFLLLSCNQDKSLSFSSLFKNHMVLQQDEYVAVWGHAKPGSQITLESDWGEKKIITTKENGEWKTQIKTLKADFKPHELSIKSWANKIIIKDILFGEVWFASGQSNMGWQMGNKITEVEGAKDEIETANFNKIRYFRATGNDSFTPNNSVNGSWKVCSPKTVTEFSAVGYYFAKELLNNLQVPIGIIHGTWHMGHPAEAYAMPELLEKVKGFEKINERIKISLDPNTPYNMWLSSHSYVELNQLINDDDSTIYFSDENKKFIQNKYNDSNWEILSLEEINEKFSLENEFDGVVWLRQTFDYQKNQIVDLEFDIGDVNDFFDIFINGKFVNRRKGYGRFESRFIIPDNILNHGINTIAIRVADMYGDGGLPKDEKRGIYHNNKKIFSFFDNWKVRFSSWKTNNRLYNLSKGFDEIIFPSKLRIPREGSKPTMLYNSLISPISPYSIKGFIWYQGENNVTSYENYRSTFLSVIKTYRKEWGNEKLPFYYVQIAPHEYSNRRNLASGEFAANLREQQRLTLSEENVGMAVTMDIGDSLDIHPKIKKPVGKRLALWALAKDYGYKNLTHSGPLFKTVDFQKSKAIISFDHIGSGLQCTDKKLKYFEIAGKDKIFQTANAQIKGDKVIAWSKKVTKPVYVRYGWKNFLTPNFFNKEGLPASSFSSINHFQDE
mgnify:CR=1 FL=1